MPSEKTPGVYVKDRPSGVRLITPAQTSVAAFIGFAISGPGTATRVRDWQEFTALFGPQAAVPYGFRTPRRPAAVTGFVTLDKKLYLLAGGKAMVCNPQNDYQPENKDPAIQLFPDRPEGFVKGFTRDGTSFFFKDDQCWQSGELKTPAPDPVPPAKRSIAEVWAGLPQRFQKDWDAAASHPASRTTFIFQGDSCLRYDDANNQPAWGNGKEIKEVFPGLPEDFPQRVDAALVVGDVLYLFSGRQTAACDLRASRGRGPALLPEAVYGYFANGGGPCYICRIITTDEKTKQLPKDEILNRFRGESTQAPHEGLADLARAPEVTMVSAPDVWNILGVRADGSDEYVTDEEVKLVYQKLAKHCTDAGNRMALLDPKQGTEPTNAGTWAGGLGLDGTQQQFAAVYYPWVTVPGLHGKPLTVPPSGHVAGVWGRSDARRGVHKAPANETLAYTNVPEHRLSDEQQGPLNDVGVNCLRSFPGRGLKVWGARTLSPETDWRYV
ncbi:phage tail sheath subtilisin-like domain-containing protein, partial [Streptomyces yunnanensis]